MTCSRRGKHERCALNVDHSTKSIEPGDGNHPRAKNPIAVDQHVTKALSVRSIMPILS